MKPRPLRDRAHAPARPRPRPGQVTPTPRRATRGTAELWEAGEPLNLPRCGEYPEGSGPPAGRGVRWAVGHSQDACDLFLVELLTQPVIIAYLHLHMQIASTCAKDGGDLNL